jgi:hypothetical protein
VDGRVKPGQGAEHVMSVSAIVISFKHLAVALHYYRHY